MMKQLCLVILTNLLQLDIRIHICVMFADVISNQTVKEHPSLLLSHSDSKHRPHASDASDDKKDQRKKKGAGTMCLALEYS